MRGFMLGGDMEPLSCPFCGSDDTAMMQGWVTNDCYAHCSACLASGPITERKQAVGMWNAVTEVLDAVKAETGLGG